VWEWVREERSGLLCHGSGSKPVCGASKVVTLEHWMFHTAYVTEVKRNWEECSVKFEVITEPLVGILSVT
jgi:hypothetical protein